MGVAAEVEKRSSIVTAAQGHGQPLLLAGRWPAKPETDRESGARAWPQLQVSRGVKGPISPFPEKNSLLWLGGCFSLASPARSVFGVSSLLCSQV